MLLDSLRAGKGSLLQCSLVHMVVSVVANEPFSQQLIWSRPPSTLMQSPKVDIHHFVLTVVRGDPTQTTPIQLDGVQVQVTVNLEQFLRQLLSTRLSNEELLYVDALCIHQNNAVEKASQVGMMGSIYANAKMVYAWLGAASSTSAAAFDSIELLADMVARSEEEGRGSLTKWVDENTSLWLENDPWGPLSELLNRAWWRRAWIVQEMVLAKSNQIMCGSRTLSFEPLHRAASVPNAYFGALTAAVTRGRNNELNPAEQASAKERLMKLLDGVANVRRIAVQAAAYLEKDEDMHLYGLIERQRMCDATDPRDRVFAYLGVIVGEDPLAQSVQVDYTVSAPELYCSIAKRRLQQTQSLDMLSGCSMLGLPVEYSSWAPLYKKSWMFSGTLQSAQVEGKINFAAATQRPASFTFAGSDAVMLVDGILIDTIAHVGLESWTYPGQRLPNGDDYNCVNVQRAWRHMAGISDDMWKNRLSTETYPSSALQQHASTGAKQHSSSQAGHSMSKKEAWVRTWLSNPSAPVYSDYWPKKNGTGADFSNRWDEFDQKQQAAVHARGALASEGRAFYTTEKGFFGLGPPKCESGDVVVALLGAQTPFILRRFNNYWKIVRETYLQGWMEGESIANVERGDNAIETFKLR